MVFRCVSYVAFAGIITTYIKVFSFIGSCALLKPNITLLGDFHVVCENETDKQHLYHILNVLKNKTTPCTVLVEDDYFSTGRKVKKIYPTRVKTGFMRGLIQRIQSLGKENTIKTICLERELIIPDACSDFNQGEGYVPPFHGYSPRKLRRDYMPNPYTFTFDGLLQEIANDKNELAESRKQFFQMVQIENFIDMMLKKIVENEQRLEKILFMQNIMHQESILSTALTLYTYKYFFDFPTLKNGVQQLRSAFELFKNDYMQEMEIPRWKERSNDVFLVYQKMRNFEYEEKNLVAKNQGYVKTIVSSIVTLLCSNSKDAQKDKGTTVQAASPRLESQISPERAAAFNELGACLMQLRLLTVDSRAVLDIVRHASQSEVMVFAGDMHVTNIRKYLADLGYEQNGYVTHKDCHQKPYLDCSEIRICNLGERLLL